VVKVERIVRLTTSIAENIVLLKRRMLPISTLACPLMASEYRGLFALITARGSHLMAGARGHMSLAYL
jgi:hypothetical protein